MEQGGVDLQKIEQETQDMISAVNKQKVAIVTEFMTHMKVGLALLLLSLFLRSLL